MNIMQPGLEQYKTSIRSFKAALEHTTEELRSIPNMDEQTLKTLEATQTEHQKVIDMYDYLLTAKSSIEASRMIRELVRVGNTKVPKEHRTDWFSLVDALNNALTGGAYRHAKKKRKNRK